MRPAPTSVRYNDWRQVEMPAPDAFMPILPVSVIAPCYQTPAETLAMTLASLEGQTYPRNLFEVVLVDDGSDPPVARPESTPLNVRIVRQERRGFGIARARNAGVRAAAHDVLLFLDSDMLVEAGWMAAHARWHHAVSDVLTVGFRGYVAMDGIDAETVRRNAASLRALLAGRPADPIDHEDVLIRTRDLTSRADDPFMAVTGGNFGIGKAFYRAVGGSDESFARWGMEEVELAYRAYTHGGLLAPVRDAGAWHQGRRADGGEARRRSLRLQYAKAAHLIAHPALRGDRPGRIFTTPQCVVTVEARDLPAASIAETVMKLLADRLHDVVVRIAIPPGGDADRLALLRETFDPDPRVRVGPARSALAEFPAASFHVTLPAGAVFARHLVFRLRARLGTAVTAAAALPGGASVSITRTWAIHRARRTGGRPADFGAARTLSAAALQIAAAGPSGGARSLSAAATEPTGYPGGWERLRRRAREVRGVADAWSFLRWLVRRWRRRPLPGRRRTGRGV